MIIKIPLRGAIHTLRERDNQVPTFVSHLQVCRESFRIVLDAATRYLNLSEICGPDDLDELEEELLGLLKKHRENRLVLPES